MSAHSSPSNHAATYDTDISSRRAKSFEVGQPVASTRTSSTNLVWARFNSYQEPPITGSSYLMFASSPRRSKVLAKHAGHSGRCSIRSLLSLETYCQRAQRRRPRSRNALCGCFFFHQRQLLAAESVFPVSKADVLLGQLL